MHGYSLHCGQTVTFFCSAHWRILQSGGPPLPVLHVQSNFASSCRNRQSLLHVGFFVVGLPVGVCGFFGHINHSIGHNRLRNEFGFGLT